MVPELSILLATFCPMTSVRIYPSSLASICRQVQICMWLLHRLSHGHRFFGWKSSLCSWSMRSQHRKTRINQNMLKKVTWSITVASQVGMARGTSVQQRQHVTTWFPCLVPMLGRGAHGDRSPMSSDLSLATHLWRAIMDPPNKTSSCCFQSGLWRSCKPIMRSALYSNMKGSWFTY